VRDLISEIALTDNSSTQAYPYLGAHAVLHPPVDVLPVADTKNYDHRPFKLKNNTIVADSELPVPLQRPPQRQGIQFGMHDKFCLDRTLNPRLHSNRQRRDIILNYFLVIADSKRHFKSRPFYEEQAPTS